METSTQTVIDPPKNELAVFSEIETKIAAIKEQNGKLVFNYTDPQGNKDARSHVFKLRQVKTQINTIHSTAKADALAFCKRLDTKRNQLIGEVEKCIEVHETPIKEIERAEAAKKAAEEAEKARLAEIERKRTENENHRKGIHDDIFAELVRLGVDNDTAKIVLGEMINGEIPHITIIY